MRIFRTSKRPHSNKLAFLGAQAFLCRYACPCAAFSSVSVRSTSHNNQFSKPIANGGLAQSWATNNRFSTSGRGSSKLFASMSGPTLTNVDKEVSFDFRDFRHRQVSIRSATAQYSNLLFHLTSFEIIFIK